MTAIIRGQRFKFKVGMTMSGNCFLCLSCGEHGVVYVSEAFVWISENVVMVIKVFKKCVLLIFMMQIYEGNFIKFVFKLTCQDYDGVIICTYNGAEINVNSKKIKTVVFKTLIIPTFVMC